MSLYEFVVGWVDRCASEPSERRGQALFNHLYLARPDLSEQLRASYEDPFYSDADIPAAMAWIATNWVGVA